MWGERNLLPRTVRGWREMTHARRLQVAGYKAVYYPGLTEDALEHCFLDMPVDLMHRLHTTPEHACGV